HRLAVDRPGRGEHPGVVVRGDQLDRSLVEEGGEARVRVPRVLLAGRLPALPGGRGGGVGLPRHQRLRRARATLCPPKPKELSRTVSWPSAGSARFSSRTTSRVTSGSRFSMLIVGGATRSRTAWAAKTASSAPAAPSRWPVIDLVPLMAMWSAS